MARASNGTHTQDFFSAASVQNLVMHGSAGKDQLVNDTRIKAVLCGDGGNDKLLGLDGDDIVWGSIGDDCLIC